MGDESTFQPFDRTGLLRRAAPFVGAMWLALVIYPLPPHGGDSDAFVTAVTVLDRQGEVRGRSDDRKELSEILARLPGHKPVAAR